MPVGYLISVALVAWCTAFALAPPRPRRSSPSNLGYWFGYLVNELPFVAFAWLLASTLLALAQGDLRSPVGWTAFGLAVLTTAGLAVVVRRGLLAGPAVERALAEELGAGSAARVRRLPLARIVFLPWPVRPREVERIANIRYGDAGRRNRLDVYRHHSQPAGAPTLVHLHGGAFRRGGKSREARSLLHRLACRGFVCVSADYRVGGPASFPDHLVDAKRVIAWVREHGAEHGADPETVLVAGSSAGGHLAATAALTPNDPEFQPGFEHADTSVAAAVCLYGFYGSPTTDLPRPSSPAAHVRADAPPFLVVHGELDTIVLVEDARRFVERLQSASSSPVVYVELPGAQHTFDLFRSLRFERVVDGVESFADWVVAGARVRPS